MNHAPEGTKPSALPWHPLLFAVIIVVTAWVDAAISPYPLVRPLLIAMLGAAALTVIAGLALRSAQAGGLVASGAELTPDESRRAALSPTSGSGLA